MKKAIRAAISLFVSLTITLTMLSSLFVVVSASARALPSPVFMKFDSTNEWWLSLVNGVKFTDHDSNIEGLQTLTTAPDGQRCVKLDYSPYGTFANYRMMPAFTKKNKVTSQHGWMRITYMTDASTTATVLNNANYSDMATLVQNTAVSNGNWVRSNAVYIANGSMLERFINGSHCTIGFHSDLDNAAIYVKEIGFFASEEQAYEYYGDTPETANYSAMTFGTERDTGLILSGDNYGNNALNDDDECVDITYASSTNFGSNYMAKLKFGDKAYISGDHKFMRVYYSADITEGQSNVEFTMRRDGSDETVTMASNVTNTDGYVLTDTLELSDTLMDRISGPYHCSFMFSDESTDSVYKIKAVYFFASQEAADKFVPIDELDCKITINQNPIEDYNIIIPEEAPAILRTYADRLAFRIYELTRYKMPILTDETPEGDYEILVGKTNRALSGEVLADFTSNTANEYQRFAVKVVNDTLVINSTLPYAIEAAIEQLITGALYGGLSDIPTTININSNDHTFQGLSSTISKNINWAEITNVSNPEVFTEDFSSDDGYFTEEQGADLFHIGGGKLIADTDYAAMTYIHVYEHNAEVTAELTYSGAGNNGNFGLMLRSTADDAYVKALYDVNAGEWRIINRDGLDFYKEVLASTKMTLTEGVAYTVTFVTDADTATLYVNNEPILSATGLTHNTPGRVGVFAEDIRLEADNFKLTLLSGQGTILRNVAHTKLPGDQYREGGSVFEMNDGSLNYTHQSGANFKSTDNGKTWFAIEEWTSYTGYVNILRLVNGDLMKVSSENGSMYSYTSDDEGKTWTKGGEITKTLFQSDTSINANAGNMNDKLNQTATGRIFYSQNYETTTSDFNGRKVFCEFFYSDNNGASWTKFDTGSWNIEGNETATHFGECKILECADGTVRIYNSYNYYGGIVYSDLKDDGKTFGSLQYLTEEFPCTCSSMQFYRDPYGETDYTYYMVWVNTQDNPLEKGMPRSSLTLAKTTDGKNWTVLGDVWRWQSTYRYDTSGAFINHIVDPFIKTTEDHVIVGTGLSEQLAMAGDSIFHGAQRQHIWSIAKDTLGVVDTPEYPTLSVENAPEIAAVGENFTVDITVSTNNDEEQLLNALNFALIYDDTKLELVSLTVGEELVDAGISVTEGAAFGWIGNGAAMMVDSETKVTAAHAKFKVKANVKDDEIVRITLGDSADSKTVMTAKLYGEGSVFVPYVYISDPIKLSEKTFEISFVKSDFYKVLDNDTQILAISSDKNDSTYKFYDYNFFWSDKYGQYLAIVGKDIDEDQVRDHISRTAKPDEDVLNYNGDISGENGVTAADAAIVSEMLHNPEGDFTDRMRLEADVFDHKTDGNYVDCADAAWILYKSVGLDYNVDGQ